MPEQTIPESVRTFLATHVSSIEELEVLLQLSGDPERWWSAKEVFEIILSNADSISNRLEKFVTNGLVEKKAGPTSLYRFAPKTDDARPVIDEMADLYRTLPVNLMRAIFSSRVDPARSFANAFKVRKE